MANILATVKVVLKMTAKWGDRALRIKQIEADLTNNTYFLPGWVAGPINQAQFSANIVTFINAETAVNAGTPGAVGLRNAAWKEIKEDLGYIQAMVQVKANANPTIAGTIIESAGFFVMMQKGGQKRINAAYNTQIPGTVIITADGGGHTQWEMSKDMTSLINLPSTNGSKTTVTALTPGDIWYFRSKKVDTAKKTYNWSPWFQLKVGSGGRNLGGGGTHSTAGNLPASA